MRLTTKQTTFEPEQIYIQYTEPVKYIDVVILGVTEKNLRKYQ